MSSASKSVTSDTSSAEVYSRLEIIVIGLLVTTAATHLYAGVNESEQPLLLAGVGFIGGNGVYAWGYKRSLLTLVAIPYTAVQIPLWYVAKAGSFTPVGYIDKAAQVILVVALVALVIRQRREP
mgnify:CR=1 FL=1